MALRFAFWVRALAVLLVSVLLLLATGCGQEEPPTSAVPELATQLEKVDAAVAAGDRALAAERVEELVATAEEARDAGDLSDEQADPIVAAAERLLEGLPDPAPEPAEDTSTPPSPAPEETEDADEGSEEEDADGEGQDDAPGSTKAEDKGQGKTKDKTKSKP